MVRACGFGQKTERGATSCKTDFRAKRASVPDLAHVHLTLLMYMKTGQNHGARMRFFSGPGVSVCKSRYDIVIWRAENRTHLSKQTRPSTERSRKASYERGIPSRPDDQLRWVLIVRTQV